MSKAWIAVRLKCPYFQADSGNSSIVCEGVIPSTHCRTIFESKGAKKQHMEAYCMADYWLCPVCSAVDEKYKED